MRILLINRMMGITWGGGENYDYSLAVALERMGHRVTVLTGQRPGDPPIKGVGQLEAIPVVTPYWRRYMYDWAGRVPLLPGVMAELDLYWFRRAVMRKVAKLRGTARFDVVQVLGLPWVASDLARIGERVAMRFPGPPAWFMKNVLRRLARGSRVAMFSHGDTVRYFSQRLGISIPEIPPGVRSDIYRPARDEGEKLAARRRLGFPPEAMLLTTVGRLVPGKGHDFLLSALGAVGSSFPQVHLAIVGDGPLRERLENRVNQYGLAGRVRFAGQKEPEEVAQHLRAADLFCLLSEYENYSNAALEAMASGLPVLATRTGGFPLQIEQGINGLLVEPGSIQDVAGALGGLAAKPELRKHLGEGASRFAARFSWEKCAAQAAEVYEQLLAA